MSFEAIQSQKVQSDHKHLASRGRAELCKWLNSAVAGQAIELVGRSVWYISLCAERTLGMAGRAGEFTKWRPRLDAT